MEIQQRIVEQCVHRAIYVLKDELGNTATGQSYNEALSYLMERRKEKRKRKR